MFSNVNLPIGVFDSGIGGLNVLYKLTKTFKNESFIYFGDNLNAPYGNKTKTDLRALCKNAVTELLNYNVKAVVVACNTASTNCLDYLKSQFKNLLIVGTFPVKRNTKNTILFATVNTAKSCYVKRNFNKCKVVPLKDLAKNVENHYAFNLPLNVSDIKKYSSASYKSIILGCTHYIFLKDYFKSTFNCAVYDGLGGVVSRLKHGLKAPALQNCERKITFIGSSAEFNYNVFIKAFGAINGCQVVVNSQKS